MHLRSDVPETLSKVAMVEKQNKSEVLGNVQTFNFADLGLDMDDNDKDTTTAAVAEGL